jgi:hypothetical protein
VRLLRSTGAFMSEKAMAIELAKNMIAAGEREGKSTTAFITGMDQPLGNAAGNWLEVVECVRVLQGKGPADLEELSVQLAAQMLVQAHALEPLDKQAPYPVGSKRPRREGFATREEAAEKAREQLRNGEAFACFRAMVAAQGGSVSCLDEPATSPHGLDAFDSGGHGGSLRVVQGVYGSADVAPSPLPAAEEAAEGRRGAHGCFWGPPCHSLAGSTRLDDFFNYSSDADSAGVGAWARGETADATSDTLAMLARSKEGAHGPPVASVAALDALAVGNANVLIGAGRQVRMAPLR